MSDARPVAIGVMRLSTDPDRDEERGVATLHAALDAGVTLIDTADAYCRDDGERGHNERLISRALATWTGDRSRVRVATKAGLTRPQGRWVPNGRARHLRSAAESSRRALGAERIDLYQLHAVDPATPLATSVRALSVLQKDGVVDQVGLCNVTIDSLREACRLAAIGSVQVELSPWCDVALRNGVLEFCVERGLTLLAYRPLGGREKQHRLQQHPVLRAVAERREATPAEIALAWLRSLAPVVVPLPGPTRPETAASAARSARITLDADDLAELDRCFPASRLVRVPRASRHPRSDAEGDVVLVMGLPGAGKSTIAADLVGEGYVRLNRDEAGGRLRDLLPALASTLAAGGRRVVLDNTYGSRAARNAVIETAWEHGVPARCVWLDTAVEDAQVNVVQRMLARYGRLLPPEELRRAARQDPGVFAPNVLYRHRRELEPPEPGEGFTRVDVVAFGRRPRPDRTTRVLMLDYDDVVWRSRSGARTPRSGDDLEILPGRAEVLRRCQAEGFRVLGMSWQPEIASRTRTEEDVAALFSQANAELGIEADCVFCPHGAGPATCWCRRPLPGLGVLLLERHHADAAQSLFVGAGASDELFARVLGLSFRRADEVFGAA